MALSHLSNNPGPDLVHTVSGTWLSHGNVSSNQHHATSFFTFNVTQLNALQIALQPVLLPYVYLSGKSKTILNCLLFLSLFQVISWEQQNTTRQKITSSNLFTLSQVSHINTLFLKRFWVENPSYCVIKTLNYYFAIHGAIRESCFFETCCNIVVFRIQFVCTLVKTIGERNCLILQSNSYSSSYFFLNALVRTL